MSQKDFTHAAAPDTAPYLVMTDLFADNGNCLVIVKHLGGRFSGHCFDGIASLIVRSDKRFNLTAQRWIISAGLTQKCRALRRVSLKCGLENLFYLLPPLWCHGLISKVSFIPTSLTRCPLR